MKKSIIIIAFLFFTGFAFSQTTVTLQDQCNCEVLSGTAVTTPGVVTPTGADTGDIYVNTNTGTIYFWDGDSWELTATDDQQLTGFSFDGITNELTLTLENGGSVNVDLSSLSDTLTDTNTTITSFDIDGTNTNLVITDSDTNTFIIALADISALVNTDTQLTDAQVATAVNNEFPNLDTDSTDDFDGEWSSLNNVPAGFADDIDNDTQLTDTQVATAVNNEFPNLDTDSTDDFSGDFTDLTNVPANLDTDSTDDFDGEWSSLNNVPAGFADDIDNDTQLTDAQVATAVNNEFPNLDTDSTDDFSGDFTDLTNVPANLDTDSTDDFDGEWSSLNNVPAGFADDIDNDDQTAGEVNLDTPIDIDGDTVDDYTTVEGVLQDVAPVIPAIKAARIFYPPSISIDASTTGTQVIDLYAQYIAQYGTPMVRSDDGGPDEAPAAIPTYADDELYYYITYADPTVFDTTSTSGPTEMTITADGELSITVIAPPADYNSLINVVFVVK
ncbi:MAG: hypothetical protein ABJF45_17490 [Flavobacteriaceae bacterium]